MELQSLFEESCDELYMNPFAVIKNELLAEQKTEKFSFFSHIVGGMVPAEKKTVVSFCEAYRLAQYTIPNTNLIGTKRAVSRDQNRGTLDTRQP